MKNEEYGLFIEALKNRTKKFGIRVIKLVEALPKSLTGKVVANQLVRSATSVGANYRAACRARSKAEFHSKLRIVIEEADECCYWLELIIESAMLEKKLVKELLKESNELTAIFVTSIKTSKSNS